MKQEGGGAYNHLPEVGHTGFPDVSQPQALMPARLQSHITLLSAPPACHQRPPRPVFAFVLGLYPTGSQHQQLLAQAPAKLLLLRNSERLTYDLKPHMHVKHQAALIYFFLTLMLYFFLEDHRNGSFLVSILLLHVDLLCFPFRSRLILSSGSEKAEPPISHFLRVSQTQAADLWGWVTLYCGGLCWACTIVYLTASLGSITTNGDNQDFLQI